jgi:histidyl-tRNA synthetase
MTVALEVLSRLGLEEVELRLSHAGLLRAVLVKLGLSPREQERIFDQILDGDMKALAGLRPAGREPGSGLMKLLNLKGKSSGSLKNLRGSAIQDMPELESAMDDFINIVDMVEGLGYDYRIDIASGRGFEYYTGVIFQLFIGGEKVGGGGRYDALIPVLGGRDIPASGFALYLDRLMNLITPQTLAGAPAQRILVRAEPLVIKEGLRVARILREAGYVAQLDLGAQEPADLRWKLDVRGKAPTFVLTDLVKSAKFELPTAGEILTILGKEVGREDSST